MQIWVEINRITSYNVCYTKLLRERQTDVGPEKHIPIVEKTENGVMIKVGEVPHPMEESHYIQLIEVIADGKVYRKTLKPGDDPSVV